MFENDATTIALATVVVIDGAVDVVDAALEAWPPWTLIGFAGSTPLYAWIDPAASRDPENVKVQFAGSLPVASRQ
jgi:hypothetical protein